VFVTVQAKEVLAERLPSLTVTVAAWLPDASHHGRG